MPPSVYARKDVSAFDEIGSQVRRDVDEFALDAEFGLHEVHHGEHPRGFGAVMPERENGGPGLFRGVVDFVRGLAGDEAVERIGRGLVEEFRPGSPAGNDPDRADGALRGADDIPAAGGGQGCVEFRGEFRRNVK